MQNVFKAVKVTDKVYWVGAIDWAVRDFHGYLTSRGSTYNAYLILADRITLMDTVKAPFADEMLARIASVVDPKDVDLIISNHAEPDHSGALPQAIAALEPRTVLASVQGVKALQENLHVPTRLEAVQDGQTISLGNLSVSCFETRMCHWPDSMVSYLHEEKTLISQDAFGMHLASYERFADEIAPSVLAEEAAKYYANILLPLSNFIAKSVDRLASSGLAFDVIAPDHGPIWRRDTGRIVGDYARWASQQRTRKAIVVYDTMWKSTELMARAMGEGLWAGGAKVRLMPMGSCHRSDVATELLDAGALVVGAPTINSEMFPTLADVLSYVKGLKPKGLIGAAFGSYGWSGEASKDLRGVLEEMKVEVVGEPIRVRYSPTADDLEACFQLGRQVAQRLGEKYPG